MQCFLDSTACARSCSKSISAAGTVKRHFVGHKMYESNGADGRMGDADQYKTKVDSETPMKIAAKIGCTVQDLLLINNQRKPTLHSSLALLGNV